MTAPAWVEPYATATRRSRIGARNLTADRCPDCKARVLTGMSDDWLAIVATVDPSPLGTLGEALAQLAGRRTYALRRHGERYRLAFTRDRWQIGGNRKLNYDIVPDHLCDQMLPAIESVHRPVQTRKGKGNERPPF